MSVWKPLSKNGGNGLVLTENSAVIHVRPDDLRALVLPGVYIFWRDDTALYIGSSQRTMARMTNPNHPKAKRALRECTNIELRICDHPLAARQLEKQLIQEFRPLYNVACNTDGNFRLPGHR